MKESNPLQYCCAMMMWFQKETRPALRKFFVGLLTLRDQKKVNPSQSQLNHFDDVSLYQQYNDSSKKTYSIPNPAYKKAGKAICQTFSGVRMNR